MKEELMHAAWRFGLFDRQHLIADSGERVEILQPGLYNTDSGPDFFNGSVTLDGIRLVGNIEMHVHADDWYAHGHETDPAYENVILHVVWTEGKTTFCGGRKIPTLSLKDKIWPEAIDNYARLMGSLGRIPCEGRINSVPDTLIRMWLSRMTAERLDRKAGELAEWINRLKYSPEQAFFILLAGNFGFHTNKVPFEELAKGLDARLFSKHKDSLFQIEALLFGRSGLLERAFSDSYGHELAKEFSFLRLKYGLAPMNPAAWKFGRTRPANFPTLRLAQLAALIYRSKFLMAALLEAESASALRKLFMAEPSEYWKSRYDFDKPSKTATGKMSDASIDLILVNTVAPFIYYTGMRSGDEGVKERALSVLESVKPEVNHITAVWREAGFSPRCAADSQGMIHLFRKYCTNRLCLQCAVGNKLLSQKE